MKIRVLLCWRNSFQRCEATCREEPHRLTPRGFLQAISFWNLLWIPSVVLHREGCWTLRYPNMMNSNYFKHKLARINPSQGVWIPRSAPVVLTHSFKPNQLWKRCKIGAWVFKDEIKQLFFIFQASPLLAQSTENALLNLLLKITFAVTSLPLGAQSLQIDRGGRCWTCHGGDPELQTLFSLEVCMSTFPLAFVSFLFPAWLPCHLHLSLGHHTVLQVTHYFSLFLPSHRHGLAVLSLWTGFISAAVFPADLSWTQLRHPARLFTGTVAHPLLQENPAVEPGISTGLFGHQQVCILQCPCPCPWHCLSQSILTCWQPVTCPQNILFPQGKFPRRWRWRREQMIWSEAVCHL